MRIGNTIENRVSTTLNITPKLQQAIRMLQLSATDLSAFVAEQVEINPLLNFELPKDSVAETDNGKNDYDDYFENDNYDNDDDSYFQNSRLKSEQTLQQYLQQQLSLWANNKIQYSIGIVLIDQLSADGYLDVDVDEVSAQLGVKTDDILETIEAMQKFDPVGIFARNVQECLKIQLIEKGIFNEKLQKLLNNLDCLVDSSPSILAKRCEMSIDELQQSMGILRTLNPRPASGFLVSLENDGIIPDGVVVKNNDETFIFELNTAVIPQVILNSDYYNELRKCIVKSDEKQFLQTKLAHANWLVNSLHQRFITLERVASAIVKYQQEFFKIGAEGLKPLTLKMIAEELDVHESTVSRITTEKYISTPRGTFELKFFFSQSLVCIEEGKSDVSAKSVQRAILNLVKEEPVNKPFSDDELAARLGDFGMLVARRTVAKYRNVLKIPSSQARRNQYVLGLKKA